MQTNEIYRNSLKAWENFYRNHSIDQRKRIIDPTWIIKTLNIQKSDRVLQIGCGTGDHIPGILESLPGIEAFGIDFSQTAIELRITNRIIKADMRFLPFKNCTFTKIFAFGVIEHAPETELIISEISRVCKPDGKIYLTVPNKISFFHLTKMFFISLDKLNLRKKKFWKLGYEKSFSLNQFTNLLRRSGFKICESNIIPSSDVNVKNIFSNRSTFIHTLDFVLNKINKNIFGFFIHVKAKKI